MLNRVEVFIQDIQKERPEFRVEHEAVMPDADEAQWVERVQLDVPRVVKHEVEGCLENLLDRVSATLKRKNVLIITIFFKTLSELGG